MSTFIVTDTIPVFPATKSEHKVVPLSVTDSSASIYPPSSAVWFYPGRIDPKTAELGLSLALNSFPQFSGKLTTSPPHGATGPKHTTRYGRVWVSYGGDDAPGALLKLARWDDSIAAVTPKSVMPGVDDTTFLGMASLADSVSVAVMRPNQLAKSGSPLVVQITEFTDATVIGIAAAHTFCDSQTLINFASDLGNAYTQLTNGIKPEHVSLPTRIFDPAIFDLAAAGDIDADREDPVLAAAADTLPMKHYDMYAARPDEAFFLLYHEPQPGTVMPPPPVIDGNPNRPPWATWAWRETGNVQQRMLHFSPEAIKRIHATASACDHGAGVTPHDAVLGMVWQATVRARGLDAKANANISQCIGLRKRSAPPISASVSGSPIVFANVSAAAEELAGANMDAGLQTAAAKLRDMVSAHTPEAVGALLHPRAFADDPVREWQCFFGREHSFTSSWVNVDMYGVEFGGVKPWYVQPAFPLLDNLVFMLPTANALESGKAWHESGVDVLVSLAPEVMVKFVKDEALKW